MTDKFEFDLLKSSIDNIVSAVKSGKHSGNSVMRQLRQALAQAERLTQAELDRLKEFTKDVHLESPKDYQPSKHYWDTDRNKDPWDLQSEYVKKNVKFRDNPDGFSNYGGTL